MKNTIAWVLAHPDDETFGSACTIKEVTQRGYRAVLLVATAGEAGKSGYLKPMTKQELALKRKSELQKAGNILGLSAIEHLGYPDGDLSKINKMDLVGDVVNFINQQQAKVVITFGEDGVSGHPDHIAIHHATKDAIFSGQCPTVQKLYYYFNFFSKENRLSPPTVKIHVSTHWESKVNALLAHESQMKSIERVFGNLDTPEALPSQMQNESFVLAWEQNEHYLGKKESFITDNLV